MPRTDKPRAGRTGAEVGCYDDACQPGSPVRRQAERGLGVRQRENERERYTERGRVCVRERLCVLASFKSERKCREGLQRGLRARPKEALRCHF